MSKSSSALEKMKFTISSHDWPLQHVDFFLATQNFLHHKSPTYPEERSLWTWRLLEFSFIFSQLNKMSVGPAERLPDHRNLYLSYEGAISNNRGTLLILDQGTAEFVDDDSKILQLRLSGQHLRGILIFNSKYDDCTNWKFSPD